MVKDKWISEALAAKKDPHTYVASKMFGVPEDKVSLQQRAFAKQRNFVFLYNSPLSIKEARRG